MSANTGVKGKIVRVSGPVIVAEGMAGVGLYDVVEAGDAKLTGEVVRLEGDRAVIQVYEENTGMKVGEPVESTGMPLSAQLGPGLIGTIYDGIQRPLRELYDLTGDWLKPGTRSHALDQERKWPFAPALAAGAEIMPGAVIGTVRETGSVLHKVMVPPGIRGKRLASVAPAGDYRVSETVARTELGEEIALRQYWPLRRARPVQSRLAADTPLITGLRVVDILFPIPKGGTAAIPGGFGTGKTMTQHAIAKWCDAEIIVYIGCGERGNEMTDVLRDFPALVDPRTGRSLMERTILIANTSNMPVAAREVSIYTGVTLAEYYRDMGYHVAIMADSTSRWAEALRELSGRMEEMPAEEGFPAYLPTRLASFYERGGRVRSLSGQEGSVTVIGAVSPPGGDFSEPVTQHTKRFIRCFWALDRELANSRHYPAISWRDSYSEYSQDLGPWWEGVNPSWAGARTAAMDILKREQHLERIVKLIGPDALPDDQRLVLLVAEMMKNGFLQQNSFDKVDMFCVPEKQVAILSVMAEFYRRALDAIRAGAPLSRVAALPCREAIPRLKSAVPNDALAGLAAAREKMEGEFEALMNQYRGRQHART